jgi:TPR repeat protein
LRIAANEGDAHSQYRYAVRLRSGEGIARDLVLGADFDKLAADQRNSDAECTYGVCLDNGDGVAMDKALAVHDYRSVAIGRRSPAELAEEQMQASFSG